MKTLENLHFEAGRSPNPRGPEANASRTTNAQVQDGFGASTKQRSPERLALLRQESRTCERIHRCVHEFVMVATCGYGHRGSAVTERAAGFCRLGRLPPVIWEALQ